MTLNPLLLQFGGSLVAIIALAGLARSLGLGKMPLLATDADVRRAARRGGGRFHAGRHRS